MLPTCLIGQVQPVVAPCALDGLRYVCSRVLVFAPRSGPRYTFLAEDIAKWPLFVG